eukprot:7028642-Pyramimonas_sp.AAC.1
MGGLTAPEGGDEALTEAVPCAAYFEVGGGDATGIDCAFTRAQAARRSKCIGAVLVMQSAASYS